MDATLLQHPAVLSLRLCLVPEILQCTTAVAGPADVAAVPSAAATADSAGAATIASDAAGVSLAVFAVF